jgi:hypothetical protein
MTNTRTRSRPTVIEDTSSSNNQTDPRHVKAIYEIIDQATIPFAAVAAKQEIDNPNTVSPFTLDIMTIKQWQQPMSVAIAELASHYPAFAIMLDKLVTATPIAAIATMAMTIGIQFAENHGALPDSLRENFPGIIKREDLAQQAAKARDDIAAEMAEMVNQNGHSDKSS